MPLRLANDTNNHEEEDQKRESVNHEIEDIDDFAQLPVQNVAELLDDVRLRMKRGEAERQTKTDGDDHGRAVDSKRAHKR